MRRNEKEVTGLSNILAILDKCDVIRLGLSADDRAYIVPMNFAYEVTEGLVDIYLHGALEGRKMDIIAQNDQVCFEADCSYRAVTAEVACKWSAEFESVMGEGRIALIAEDDQKIHAMDVFMARNGFQGSPGFTPKTLAKVAVLRLSVASITGKSSIKNA